VRMRLRNFVPARPVSSANCCPLGSECFFPPPIELDNAYDFETVTIYYRWHPLFNSSLPVRSRRKNGNGDRIYCESNGKIYPIPIWMLSPECSQFSLGPPLISVKALLELRDLFASLPLHADCDKSPPNSSSKEEADEAIGKTALPADESSNRQRTTSSDSRRPAKGTNHRSDGTIHQRSARKNRAARKRRRG
jgi:hypothetical protein